MEHDLIRIRRWLLEDFKARASTVVPVLLARNPTMEAFDLMAAVEATETLRPLKPEQKAFLLDLYLQARWVAPTTRRRVRAWADSRRTVYRR